MKYKLFSSALVTMLGVTAMAGSALATDPTAEELAARELKSTGSIEIQLGSTSGTEEPPVDPEDPTKPFEPEDPTDIDENTNVGPLTIQQVSKLKFPMAKTATSDINVTAEGLKMKDGTTRGALVGFSDVRAGGIKGEFGYTITAEMSNQFTGSKDGDKLTASTITYSNGSIVNAAGNENTPGALAGTSFELTEENGAQPIVTAKSAAKEGKGKYVLQFGKYDADAEKNTTDKSVNLFIPQRTASNMAVDTYTADITWKIAPEVAGQ